MFKIYKIKFYAKSGKLRSGMSQPCGVKMLFHDFFSGQESCKVFGFGKMEKAATTLA
jgi:hypothetical protein